MLRYIPLLALVLLPPISVAGPPEAKARFPLSAELMCVDGQIPAGDSYGPAEKPMRRYLAAWERALSKRDCAGDNWLTVLSPAFLKQTREMLGQAEKLAAKDTDALKAVARARTDQQCAEAVISMRRYGRASESVSATEMILFALDQAVAAGQKAQRIIRDSAPPGSPQDNTLLEKIEAETAQYRTRLEAAKARKPAS